MKIPNKEVLDTFRKRTQVRYSKNNRAFVLSGQQIIRKIFDGDADGVKDTLLRILTKYVSVRDSATRAPAENYYHGLLIGLFCTMVNCDISNFESNAEAGNGYADILFTSLREDVGVVLLS